ncbi:acyl carrier protein [Pedobacter alpinus]|uniref:Acyl carrier protein n=1 Tax=Pedobacter alpinus TaxID=1590643 RepID=A0ABW5TQ65_9SPHI
MDIKTFISKLDVVFEETDLNTIKPDTQFKQLEEWDSMLALSMIAMVDDEYSLKLTGDDIRTSTTIQDLFSKIEAKA